MVDQKPQKESIVTIKEIKATHDREDNEVVLSIENEESQLSTKDVNKNEMEIPNVRIDFSARLSMLGNMLTPFIIMTARLFVQSLLRRGIIFST